MRVREEGMNFTEKIALYLVTPNPSMPETYYNEMFCACSKPKMLLTVRLASSYMMLFLYRLIMFEPLYITLQMHPTIQLSSISFIQLVMMILTLKATF